MKLCGREVCQLCDAGYVAHWAYPEKPSRGEDAPLGRTLPPRPRTDDELAELRHECARDALNSDGEAHGHDWEAE